MKKLFAIVAVICLLASACGNDDDSPAEAPAATEAPAPATSEPTAAPEPAMTPEPTAAPEPASTPEPTAAPEPASTPEPTAAPEPAEAPEEEEPPPSMDSLVIDADTTGGDVLEHLTDAERDCIEADLGDDYGLLAVTPLGSLREVGVADGLFGCLDHENLLTVGTATTGLFFGGRTPETTECVREVYSSTPDVFYKILGVGWDGPTSTPDEISQTTQGVYQCMNPLERTSWMLYMWDRMAAITPDTGSDYVELLTADEIACASEAVGEEAVEEVLEQRPLQVWRAYPAVQDCFSPGTMGKLFAQYLANQVGGITDSSFECVQNFAAQRPNFVLAIANGRMADSFEENVDVSQFAIDVFAFYGCLSAEERGVLQDVFLERQ